MKRRLPLVAAVVVLAALGWWLWPSDASSDASSNPAPSPERPVTRRNPPLLGTPTDALRGPSVALDEEKFARVVTVSDAGSGADGGEPEVTAALDAFARGQVLAWLKENAEQAAKNVDEYCKQTKDIVKDQEKRDTREHDAALYMLGRCDWEGGRLGTLHLAEALTDRMKSPPGAWRQFGASDYAGLDFSWMKDIQQFDHWSLAHSPTSELAADTTFFEAPIPNFIVMQNWAKLRLVKGRTEGDLQTASVEVRHLADLCGSTGTLVGEMIRVAILGIERGFIEEHHLAYAPAMSWTEAQRMRWASFAAVDFLLPGVDPAVKKKALNCIPNRCSAMNEALGMARATKDLISSGAEDLQWLLDQKPCDPAFVEASTRFKPMNPAGLISNGAFPSIDETMAKMLDAGTPPP